jgi:hypothetical protein
MASAATTCQVTTSRKAAAKGQPSNSAVIPTRAPEAIIGTRNLRILRAMTLPFFLIGLLPQNASRFFPSTLIVMHGAEKRTDFFGARIPGRPQPTPE